MTEHNRLWIHAGETKRLLPKAKNKVRHLKCVCDFKSKNLFWNVWIQIVCILPKETDILCQYKEENFYNFTVFLFWKTRLYSHLQRTFTYIDQNVRKTLSASWLSVYHTATQPSVLLVLGLCIWTSFSVAAYVCYPSPCFHSISENSYFYINYKVTASSMYSRDR